MRQTLQRTLKSTRKKLCLPSLTRWIKKLPLKERLAFYGFGYLLILSFGVLLTVTFVFRGKIIPVSGGGYTEGVIGSPRSINPVLSPSNEVDRALVKLIYPSLLTPASDGMLVPMLAQSVSVKNNGKTYEFTLKANALWEDGEPIKARDVVFTIKTIQDERVASPLNRLWSGVSVEAVGEHAVRFTLPRPYAFFLQNATLGILPAHIWEKTSPQDMALSPYNRAPVGAGPYTLKAMEGTGGNITRALLARNPSFFGEKPFIDLVMFRFYPDSDHLFEALQKKEVDSIPVTSLVLYEKLKNENGIALHSFLLPRYFAVFLNAKENKALAQKNVRQALLLAIQKNAIIADVLKGQAQAVSTPIAPALKNYYRSDLPHDNYDPKRARLLLAAAGFGKTPLRLELVVIDNDSLLAVANRIVEDWKAVGVDATMRDVTLESVRNEILQKRSYQAFLFGQALALEPDPFSLWHSSQQAYPGFNLSSYSSDKLDTLLEELRETFDKGKQRELFADFQKTMEEDLPALFLYSPYQIFAMRTTVQGVTPGALSLPEDRFNQIAQWYVATKREN